MGNQGPQAASLGNVGAGRARGAIGDAVGWAGEFAPQADTAVADNMGNDAQLLTRLAERLADRNPTRSSQPVEDVSEDEEIEYTYKQGDNFGQIIKDLNLNTDYGLWGNSGDVKFYEDQLREQGWDGGNIPVGTKIKLRKRPNVRYDMYGNPMKD